MTEQIQTINALKSAGRSHLSVAKKAANSNYSTDYTPAYLAHLSIECVLKAHLLYRSGCYSKEELLKKHPKVHDAMFKGKQAHDLERVAEQVGLPALMRNNGKNWRTDACWTRFTQDERPYSLRYGYAEIDNKSLNEEIQRADEIVTTVLSASPSNRSLSGTPRKQKR